jgi:uncharacterized LabA/DUF88 family protein
VGKNVAVFVDVANIFYAAKAAGVDIDYVTLLKASSAGRDLVRAYAYTGLDPENENQRNFHDFLRRHGYRVVSKDIRKYGDGKVKANLDIELVVDMMKTARNLDVAIVVSGDGDFAPAIRAVQEQGVRVEVVSFRGNTSSDLMDVADLFTDITQIAKVEKGSSRSGRRVATDDEDLSMTEVPDKQSEGTGERTRGRGRTRRVAAATTAGGRGRGRAAAEGDGAEPALVVLPGEKLSRVAASAEPAETDVASVDDVASDGADDGAALPDEGVAAERGLDQGGEEGRRRRRRRGGRGRGRGRGREEEGFVEAGAGAPRGLDDEDAAEDEEAPPPSRRAASTFGSVWDSQIGIPSSRGAPLVEDDEDDEDLEEPAVPEYLLAERRQRDGGRGRGGRGRGGAYAAALDRERFGGGRGSTPSRFGEPAPRREGAFGRPDRGGADRERGGRERANRGDRQPFRGAPRPAPRGSGDEPWSEVPPEIEAMLRAQLGSRAASEPRRAEAAAPADVTPIEAEPTATTVEVPTAATPRRSRSTGGGTRGGRRTSASTEAPAGADEAEVVATPRRTPRSRAAAGASGSATKATRTSTRRTGTRAATAEAGDSRAEAASAADGEPAAAPVPKRRATRKKADPSA